MDTEFDNIIESLLNGERPVISEESIQPNPSGLILNEVTSRFSSAVWYNKIKEANVVLAGVGGIGSYVAFLLSRLDIASLIMYDPDTVEEGNLSGQLYGAANINGYKVIEMANLLHSFSHFDRVRVHNSEYTAVSNVAPIMICGFDNMEARKIFYNNWKNYLSTFKTREPYYDALYIDGRLAAEKLQIFCITADDTRAMEEYEKEWLFTDDEADETICSYKQTTFMANMIASMMVNLFVNFIANHCPDILIPRDLPFITEYDASTMYLKVKS